MGDLYDRTERGHEIAKSPDMIEEVVKNVFSVQSQSGPGVYIVSFENGRWKCNCADFRAHDLPCKHIYAVRERRDRGIRNGPLESEPKRPRPTYRQNWSPYNASHRAESYEFGPVLQDLVADLEDPSPPKVRGRHRLPYSDLVFCAVVRYFERKTLRKAKRTYDLARQAGLISCLPSDNMPSLLLRRPETTPVLTDLIARSAAALTSVETTFAVDSSGFRTTSFGDYCRETHGARIQNIWKKLHIVVGTQTGIIPAVVVTESNENDSPEFRGLIEALVGAGFTVGEVYADKGYLSGENFTVVGKAGGVPYILFKENSRGRAKHRRDHSPWWKIMYHKMEADPSDYLKHYHKRSNVESTFAAIKKKLGESLGSKDPIAQQNELLCKVLIHNIQILIQASFERGIPLPGREIPEPAPEDLSLPNHATGPLVPAPGHAPASIPPWQPGDNN